jgi:amino acid transporter
MAQLDKLETKLDEVLDKKAPFKLPESSRKSLAGALWWLSLIGGLLQLYAAWNLWDNWHFVDKVADTFNTYAEAYGIDTGYDLGFGFYLALITLAVSGALLLLAAPGLKAMKKSGWNLVFYSLLVNLVYGVVALFTDYGDLGSFIGALIGSVIGGYLLFQVRSHFNKKA